MEISVLQANLSKALTLAKPFSARGGYLPITQTVCLSSDRGMLRLEVTDLEKSFTTWIGAMVHEEGTVCVNADMLTKFIRTLKDDRVDMKVVEKERGNPTLLITCGEYVDAEMPGVSSTEFPPLPELNEHDESSTLISFDPHVLRTGFTRLGYCVSPEDARPVLAGMRLEMRPDGYTMAAADGFRLGVQSGLLIDPPKEEVGIIIPRDTVSKVAKLLKGCEDPVRVIVGAQNGQPRVCFKVGGCEVISQVISGTFPNYGQLIPQEFDWKVKVHTRDLKGATESAAVYADAGDSKIIRFWMEPSEPTEGVDAPPVINVSAQTEDKGHAKREARCIDAEGLDSTPRIAFNRHYVADVFQMAEGVLEMSGTTSSSPGVFSLPDDEGFKLVIMPMVTKW